MTAVNCRETTKRRRSQTRENQTVPIKRAAAQFAPYSAHSNIRSLHKERAQENPTDKTGRLPGASGRAGASSLTQSWPNLKSNIALKSQILPETRMWADAQT